jgi:hypothetical protein
VNPIIDLEGILKSERIKVEGPPLLFDLGGLRLQGRICWAVEVDAGVDIALSVLLLAVEGLFHPILLI